MGKTLSHFAEDGMIPVYGFGDERTTDEKIFALKAAATSAAAAKTSKRTIEVDDAFCPGFEEVLAIYNRVTPQVELAGPTNFVPLIEKSIEICQKKSSVRM